MVNVSPQVYYDAAKKLRGIHTAAQLVFSPLLVTLINSRNMAGNYDKVRTWSSGYDDNSTDLLDTFTTYVNAMANFADILDVAGHNWAYSNWLADINPNKGGPPDKPTPSGLQYGDDTPFPSSAFGGNAVGLDTKIPGLLDKIGFALPNGDTTLLDGAASAWEKFSGHEAITGASGEIKSIMATFTAADASSPDLEDVETHLTTLSKGADAIAGASKALAGPVRAHQQALTSFRSDLNDHVDSLMKDLFWIALGTAAAVGLTELLTVGVATLGPVEAEAAGGTAAGVTAVGESAETIANLWRVCRLLQVIEIGIGIGAAASQFQPLDIQKDLDDIASLVAVSVAGAMVSVMAKGGKQRVADSGIEQEMNDMIKSGAAASACEALAQLWDTAGSDGKRRQRIKKTQKQYGCRHSSGGGGK
ncbi:hypothetical protein KO481_05235 [Nocardia sp. NEAU-G5]|uniref:Bacterial toxin 34 domain-containing protein n=1 Tax=Nocardia albiluteola TaxID=2842303 RepID=A0ABS6AUJ7_9NOCA|nr:polymorphic toxin type 34 domain-containing protein [Nocardia albiluteola]MBU3060926.1 hypothetical protein [Nocardia albiluteola]